MGITSTAADGSAADPLGSRVPGPVCQLGSGAVFKVHLEPPDRKDETLAAAWARQGAHPLTAPHIIIALTRPDKPPLTPGRVIESKKEISAQIRDQAPYRHKSEPTTQSALPSSPFPPLHPHPLLQSRSERRESPSRRATRWPRSRGQTKSSSRRTTWTT